MLRLWNALRAALVEAISDEGGILRQRGVAAVRRLAAGCRPTPRSRAASTATRADAAVYVIDASAPEIASVITDTVNRWDGKEAARRIELHVGRDLQFIRINGTLVRWARGRLVIHAVSGAVCDRARGRPDPRRHDPAGPVPQARRTWSTTARTPARSLQAGEVLVNGEVETRRGRQLVPGDSCRSVARPLESRDLSERRAGRPRRSASHRA